MILRGRGRTSRCGEDWCPHCMQFSKPWGEPPPRRRGQGGDPGAESRVRSAVTSPSCMYADAFVRVASVLPPQRLLLCDAFGAPAGSHAIFSELQSTTHPTPRHASFTHLLHARRSRLWPFATSFSLTKVRDEAEQRRGASPPCCVALACHVEQATLRDAARCEHVFKNTTTKTSATQCTDNG